MCGMRSPKKQKKQKIEHDEVVRRFARKLQELRVARGLSQVELAGKAGCTSNYVSKLERAGAAPGIDLVARLARALGVAVAELLPTEGAVDEVTVLRERARALFGELIASSNETVLVLLVQLMARLTDATSR